MSNRYKLFLFLALLADTVAANEVEKIRFPAGDDRLPAFRAIPEGDGPFPAVLFLHGGRGGKVGGDPRASLAALARSGYVGLAPMRLEAATLKTEIDQTRSALAYLKNLRQVDPQRIAVIGFSRGGLLALIAAVEHTDLRAAILMAPAPGRGALDRALGRASQPMPPVLVLVAENDTHQADHVTLARQTMQQLRSKNVAAEWILYPPFGPPAADGHQLFFRVRDGYWSDVRTFLTRHLQTE
ncbi:MAG: dienelactone hydrolase family protein [Pirellulales bacterium]|nr:dienelactone hydrolase family protein [Pirellulales bacterium]